jgi:hypothetical protein
MNDTSSAAGEAAAPLQSGARVARAEVHPLLRTLALHGAVVMLFTALSIWNTWPLARDMRGHLIEKDDVYMNVWHLWWMRQALWEAPQNPFEPPLLHHPIGAELYWHTLAPAKTALGVPLLAVMEPVTAYNFALFGTFVLAGYTAWILLRYLLRRAQIAEPLAGWASIAGACAFTFSPYHFAQATAHLNLAAIEGIPLYVYFFLRWMDEGRRKLLWGMGLSALYVCCSDFYYVFYVALFSLAWVVADRWQRGPLFSMETLSDDRIRRAAVGALACAAALLPPLIPLLLHLEPPPIQIHHGDSDYYVDLMGLVVPDPYSGWLASMPADWQRTIWELSSRFMARNLEETGYFLGWGIPLACTFALAAGVPYARRWVTIGAIFLVLSMGTLLQIAGQNRHTPVVLLLAAALILLLARSTPAGRWRKWDVLLVLLASAVVGMSHPFTAFGAPYASEIPLPYLVFKSVVPLFGQAGMPVRFEFMVTLVMAVLVAFAAGRLGAWASRKGSAAGLAAATLVVAIPNLDYHRVPMPLAPAPVLPAIFQEIAAAPPDVAVATDSVMGQFEQVYHRHPITFARQSRLPVRELAFERSPLIAAFHRHQCDSNISEAERAGLRQYLRTHKIRYYVAHWTPCDAFMREILGGTLAYTDGRRWVYRFD